MRTRSAGLRLTRASVGGASVAGFAGVIAALGPFAPATAELVSPDLAPVALASDETLDEQINTTAAPQITESVALARIATAPTQTSIDDFPPRMPREAATSTIAPSTTAPPTTAPPTTAPPKAPTTTAPVNSAPATTASTTAAPAPTTPKTTAPSTTAPSTTAPVSPTTAAPTTVAPTSTTAVATTTTVATTSSTTSTTLPPLTGGSN